MNTCKNCEHAKYDDRFGGYKCTVYQHKIRDAYKYIDCESHKQKGKREN